MSSLYASKILLGGVAAVVGTGGTIYLAQDQIWPKNKLSVFGFLPWDCRKKSSTTCELSSSDLKQIHFEFNASKIESPKIEDGKEKVATITWTNPSENDASPENREFTIRAKNSDLTLKSSSDENITITIAQQTGTKFLIKKNNENIYYFSKKVEATPATTKLTDWDSKLISEIEKLSQVTLSDQTTATASNGNSQLKLSLTTNPSSGETTPKNVEIKLEISNKTNDQAIVDDMKVWECKIQGTISDSNKEFFVDTSGKTDQFSELKKSFGMDSSNTSPVTLTQEHKSSIKKFVTKCAELSTTKPTSLDDNKKLSRSITKNLVAKDSTDQNKLKFGNLEEFFKKDSQ